VPGASVVGAFFAIDSFSSRFKKFSQAKLFSDGEVGSF
jgi:hypothetical protein